MYAFNGKWRCGASRRNVFILALFLKENDKNIVKIPLKIVGNYRKMSEMHVGN
jgi:hypothetical protein